MAKRLDKVGEDGLTDKQRIFVEAYVGEARCNATEAARMAGYAEPNTQGPRLLVNVSIRSAIDKRLEQVKSKVGPERIFQFYADVLDSDIGDYFDVQDLDPNTGYPVGAGGRLPMLNLSKAKHARRLGLITEMAFSDQGAPKIKLYSKMDAAKELARLYQLVNDGVNVTVAPKIYGHPVMDEV